jgi:ornithine cyclodeaminase/alanine dehydrogenase-like protein (mu-crystallin family)
MRFFDADATRAAIPVGELLDAVEAAYRDVAAGRDRSPTRTRVELPSGDLLLMPGVREGGVGSTVKLVTIVPANADRGLPTLHALVVWIDATTGEPLALLDGATVTAMRTGAASGVATRLLARPDASVLGLIGAGGQAEWQLRAVAAARPIREVRVFSRSAASRLAFVERMTGSLGPGIEIRAAASARDAVRGADVVCCATTAMEPVFAAEWLAPGVHVNGVGAFRLDMVELPPALFARADLVAVDSREAALAEAGDLVAALEGGQLAADGYIEIGSIGQGWSGTRDSRAITVFKSVGLALQDVAAAEVAMRRLFADTAAAAGPV